MENQLQKNKDDLGRIIQKGFENAAGALERMIGLKISIVSPTVKAVQLSEIPHVGGGPEMDAVGIYLHMEGELESQVLLIFPYEKALELADTLMERTPGESEVLGALERSALAEIGNLTGSFFVNAMDEILGLGARPSPPAVVVDMLGSILDVIVASLGSTSHEVLMFSTCFYVGEKNMTADFWIIPEDHTLRKMLNVVKGTDA